jgi:FixJ family two-component response regulator
MHPFAPNEDWVGIVDDDDSIQRSLARLLRVNGIHAETFGSAEEFFRHRKGPPSCLIVDVQLGPHTGFDLRDQFIAQGTRVPPIIFITAREDLTALQFEHGQGAYGWLGKPLRADALLALVRPHLRLPRARYRNDATTPSVSASR